MASQLIKCDQTKPLPRNLIRAGKMLKEAMLLLEASRAAYIQSRDGDGSQSAHYDLTAVEGGYTAGDYADANAAAKASFDELDSLYAKVCTDGATSNVRSAILQFVAKHGEV